MNEKIILNLTDELWGKATIGAQLSQEAILCLLTWAKTSNDGYLPENIMFDGTLSVEELRERFFGLKRFWSENGKDLAFKAAHIFLTRESEITISEVSNKIDNYKKQGMLEVTSGDWEISDFMTLFDGYRSGEYTIPSELADLLIYLVGPSYPSDEEVYLPWDQQGQLTGRVHDREMIAFVESSSENKSVVELMAIYNSREFEAAKKSSVLTTDPITNPSFVINGQLKKFTKTIATPPLGGKVSFNIGLNDPLDRFGNLRTNSYSVLSILHAMKQTEGKIAVLVNNGVLFSSGGERELRQLLVTSGQLQAVIALPGGLLASSSIALSILVIDTTPGTRHESIQMVNCDLKNSPFYIDTKGRKSLMHVDHIEEMANGTFKHEACKKVPITDIDQADFNLMPSRYVLDQSQADAQNVLGNYKVKPLEDLVQIFRAQTTSSTSEGVNVFEVGAPELTFSGYFNSPKKIVHVDIRDVDQFIQPRDVILTIKGSVGKVAIAPLDTPKPGQGGWIIGQSQCILRSKGELVTPEVLVTFLRSDVGQMLIEQMTAGATIKFLQLKEIRKLKIPILNNDEQHEIEKLFHRQVTINNELRRLQQELDAQKHAKWTIAL
jgi:type I restriction enzyme M protein